MRTKLIILFILLSVTLTANLYGIKEMKARQIEPPTVRELFLSNPEDGGLVIYTTIPNLRFDSNMNSIVKVDEMPLDGKYKLYLKTMRNQIIIIKSVGYAECHIHISNLQAQEGRYYALEDISEEAGIGNSVPVIFNVKPADATILVGGKTFKSGEPQPLALGRHQVKISQEGYKSLQDVIEVSETSILFNYDLKQIDVVLVTVNSTPDEADIYVDNVNKGKSPRTFYLYPGTYNVKVQKDNYLEVAETIDVTEKGTNSFSYRLTKNSGYLSISVKTANAKVYLNNEPLSSYSKMELSPGFYKIEVKAESHESFTETVEVKLGETLTKSITLVPKYGELMFLVNPNTATIEISQKGTVIKTIIGSQIIRDLLEGDYDIIANASGFKSYKGKFNIKDKERTELNIEMQKGSDVPANMVLVDGGTFKRDDYSVTVSSFFIGKYEVTQKEWQSIMGNNPSDFKGDNRPVEEVTWYDAVEYCNKLSKKEGLTPVYTINGNNVTCNWSANGYRLPTEAEWEYAARGGNKSKGYTYSGSNIVGNVAWYDSNSSSQTHDVGTKAPNELGIYDMSGNVWEWCWDWYDSSYYSNSPKNDPKGANSGSDRVVRGGSWYLNDFGCRVAYRVYSSPGFGNGGLGLRVLRTIQ